MTVDDIQRGRELLSQLAPVLERDRRLAMRGAARLFPRLPPPEALERDERFDVDLDAGVLEHMVGAEPITTFTLQVVGLYRGGPDGHGELVWGWHVAGVPASAHAAVRRWIRRDLDLAPIAGLPRFQVSQARAERIAQLVAVRSGAVGAYPWRRGGETIFLALRDADPIEPGAAEPVWCLVCGDVPEDGDELVHGAWGGVCRACCQRLVPELRSQRGARGQGARGAGEVHATSQPDCFLCGEVPDAVPVAYAALHARCVERARARFRLAAPERGRVMT